MKFSGKLVRSDLEGGLWTLESNGEVFHLIDEGDHLSAYNDGDVIEVDADKGESMMGIGMIGSMLLVNAVTKAGC